MGPVNAIAANRRSRQRVETRARIVAAARKLFINEGYEQTTMRRIADEVEYSPGAIYSYFPDKDAILYALHSEGFLELARYMGAAVKAQATPVAMLAALGRGYLRFAKDHPEMYDLMFVAKGPTSQMVEKWPEGTAAYNQLLGVVTLAIEGHWILGGDPQAVAFAMWSMCHGMATLDYRERCLVIPEDKRDTVTPQGFDYVIAAITVPPAERQARMQRGATTTRGRAASKSPAPAASKGKPRRSRPEI